MERCKTVTQVTVKRNPKDKTSIEFFQRIENRNRGIYPTIFSYLNAAVQSLEISVDDDRAFPILSETDLQQIELIVLKALRIYEIKKKEEQMVP